MGRPEFRVGCSGWQYRHWRGEFYPVDLPLARWFEFYARTFDTVEVNNSFYRLPEASTFRRWREGSPADFLFAVKASRYLTHMKKLKDPEQPLELFFSRAGELGPKLGPVLYQLPPRWPVNLERLEGFLRALPRGVAHVIEFRNGSWYVPAVFRLLERFGVTLCLHDMPGSATEQTRVGPLVYLRFHGSGARYGGGYPEQQLADRAAWIRSRLREGVPVYAYFNNDAGGHAPRDASTLRRLVSS
jgi:uncharacterized protein YecE (DUF72 family)